MNKVHINTIGCIEALCDENKYRAYLQQNNWLLTDDPKTADVIIFNTCGLRIEEVTQAISRYNKIKRTDTELIICGCFPSMNKQAFEKVFQGRYFGPRQPEKLAEYLNIDKSIDDVNANTFTSQLFILRQQHKGARVLVRAIEKITKFDNVMQTSFNDFLRQKGLFWYNSEMFFIKVATGCTGKCAYCSIPLAKGMVVSVPLERVIMQFHHGRSLGKKEFVLSAEDVGCYGQDIGTNIAELLNQMSSETGDYLIHIRYIDPYFLIRYFEKLCSVFSQGKVASFCSAVQSGSNRVLKLMNKKYRIEDYIKCIDHIHKYFPQIIVRTHIIVGFPQETEDDFLSTYDMFDQISFNQVSIYGYKQEPWNLASKMDGQIPDDIKKNRTKRLRKKLGFRGLSQTN